MNLLLIPLLFFAEAKPETTTTSYETPIMVFKRAFAYAGIITRMETSRYKVFERYADEIIEFEEAGLEEESRKHRKKLDKDMAVCDWYIAKLNKKYGMPYDAEALKKEADEEKDR